jgi:hypothetical protein
LQVREMLRQEWSDHGLSALFPPIGVVRIRSRASRSD